MLTPGLEEAVEAHRDALARARSRAEAERQAVEGEVERARAAVTEAEAALAAAPRDERGELASEPAERLLAETPSMRRDLERIGVLDGEIEHAERAVRATLGRLGWTQDRLEQADAGVGATEQLRSLKDTLARAREREAEARARHDRAGRDAADAPIPDEALDEQLARNELRRQRAAELRGTLDELLEARATGRRASSALVIQVALAAALAVALGAWSLAGGAWALGLGLVAVAVLAGLAALRLGREGQGGGMQVVAQRAAALSSELGIDGEPTRGAVTALEQRLEDERRRLEQALERRERRRHLETAAGEAERAARAAAQATEATEGALASWLTGRGLDAGLSADGALDALALVREGQQALRVREGRRAEKVKIIIEINGFCERAGRVAAMLGEGAPGPADAPAEGWPTHGRVAGMLGEGSPLSTSPAEGRPTHGRVAATLGEGSPGLADAPAVAEQLARRARGALEKRRAHETAAGVLQMAANRLAEAEGRLAPEAAPVVARALAEWRSFAVEAGLDPRDEPERQLSVVRAAWELARRRDVLARTEETRAAQDATIADFETRLCRVVAGAGAGREALAALQAFARRLAAAREARQRYEQASERVRAFERAAGRADAAVSEAMAASRAVEQQRSDFAQALHGHGLPATTAAEDLDAVLDAAERASRAMAERRRLQAEVHRLEAELDRFAGAVRDLHHAGDGLRGAAVAPDGAVAPGAAVVPGAAVAPSGAVPPDGVSVVPDLDAPCLPLLGPAEAVAALVALQGRVASARRARAALDEARVELAERAGQHERALTEAARVTGALASLLAAQGVESVRSLEERARAQAERRATEVRVRSLEQAVRAAVGDDAHDALDRAMAAGGQERLLEERERLAEQLAALDRERDSGIEERSAAEARAAEVEQSADVVTLETEQAVASEKERALTEELLVLSLADALLDATLERYRRERQPDVLRSAGALFERVTAGRYTGVLAGVDGRDLTIVDALGGTRSTAELSTGTAEQLYLCLRLALALEFGRRATPLPIVLDDVLVNFDPERALAMADVLVEVGRRHQTLLLTCRPETVEAIRSVDPRAPVLHLERFGGRASPASPAAASA